MLKVEAVLLPLAGGFCSFKYTSALKKIKRLRGKSAAVRKIRAGISHGAQVKASDRAIARRSRRSPGASPLAGR